MKKLCSGDQTDACRAVFAKMTIQPPQPFPILVKARYSFVLNNLRGPHGSAKDRQYRVIDRVDARGNWDGSADPQGQATKRLGVRTGVLHDTESCVRFDSGLTQWRRRIRIVKQELQDPSMVADLISLRPWLDHLTKHIPIAKKGDDPEGVHQIRVATRRLNVWLDLAGRRVLRDDLRWLRRRAGVVRDIDVLLHEIKPPPPLAQWLEEELKQARRELLVVLDHPRLCGLLAALGDLPAIPEAEAHSRLARIVGMTFRRGLAVEQVSCDLIKIHRLRRGVRRLRYALEWLGEKPRPLKALQTVLGDVNDQTMTLRYLYRSPVRDSLEEYRTKVEAKLAHECAAARDAWITCKETIQHLL